MEFTTSGVPAITTRFGPNLISATTAMNLAELHQFLGYRVEDEVAAKADGDIADTYRAVQRPLLKERQREIATYQERTLLSPRPLDEAIEQGYQPAITLIADIPLKIRPIPGAATMMGMQYSEVVRDENATVIVSDGVGRVSGLEFLERTYQKGPSNVEQRRRQMALASLRIPVLILFPITGRLSEGHFQQALFDQNVLAQPLKPALALTMDHRSPYTEIMRKMFTVDPDDRYKLRSFGFNQQAKSHTKTVKEVFLAAPMVKFIKVATEGPKFAESARGSGSFPEDRTTEAAQKLAFFWAEVIAAAKSVRGDQFDPATVADNMALSGPGLTALGLVAHELFFGEGKDWTPGTRLDAIRRIGSQDWSRSNETWRTIDVLQLKDGKYVSNSAGASSARRMTAHFRDLAGFAPKGEERETAA